MSNKTHNNINLSLNITRTTTPSTIKKLLKTGIMSKLVKNNSTSSSVENSQNVNKQKKSVNRVYDGLDYISPWDYYHSSPVVEEVPSPTYPKIAQQNNNSRMYGKIGDMRKIKNLSQMDGRNKRKNIQTRIPVNINKTQICEGEKIKNIQNDQVNEQERQQSNNNDKDMKQPKSQGINMNNIGFGNIFYYSDEPKQMENMKRKNQVNLQKGDQAINVAHSKTKQDRISEAQKIQKNRQKKNIPSPKKSKDIYKYFNDFDEKQEQKQSQTMVLMRSLLLSHHASNNHSKVKKYAQKISQPVKNKVKKYKTEQQERQQFTNTVFIKKKKMKNQATVIDMNNYTQKWCEYEENLWNSKNSSVKKCRNNKYAINLSRLRYYTEQTSAMDKSAMGKKSMQTKILTQKNRRYGNNTQKNNYNRSVMNQKNKYNNLGRSIIEQYSHKSRRSPNYLQETHAGNKRNDMFLKQEIIKILQEQSI